MGQGSTFWFTLRLEKQPKDAVGPIKYSRDLIDLRVLVVDDNDTNRQILGHQIRSFQMHEGRASSGREALQMLREEAAAGTPFDLALVDMQMPEMDGMTLARAIKAEPSLKGTRVVILTSLGQRPDRAELAAPYIEAYLVKPIKQSRLFDCLVNVMRKQDPEEASEIAGASPLSTASGPQPADLPARKIRILLADDNSINQNVALGQLKTLGHTADAVGNGSEVLEALRLVPYDVVLMDCQMPEMDGYEAARAIRQNEKEASAVAGRVSHIHIIAMTANAMRGDREKCLAAGMDDYVSKPVRTAELRAALDRFRPAGQPTEGHATGSTRRSVTGTKTDRAAAPEEPPVDMARLLEMADQDPEQMPGLADLYLKQAAELMGDLHAAIQAGSASDMERLAHKLCGSSSTCGMTAIVSPLHDLEVLGHAGRLPSDTGLFDDAHLQLRRIRAFLASHLH